MSSCAIHFSGNRSEEQTKQLQLKLNEITVHTVDDIVTDHTLEGQGINVEYTNEGGVLLREEDSKLIIYVSNDAEEKDFTWHWTLPQKLCGFLNVNNEKGSLIISNILNLKLSYMDKLLDPFGVPRGVEPSLLRRSSLDSVPSFGDVDHSNSRARDKKEGSVSRRTLHRGTPTIYIDCEEPEIVKSKSKVEGSDKDELMLIPQYAGDSIRNAQQTQDKTTIIKNEVIEVDALYGPPSPGTGPRNTSTASSHSTAPSSTEHKQAESASPNALSSNGGVSNGQLSQPESESSKKRKADLLDLNVGQANKRTSDLPRGFGHAVKKRLRKNIEIGVPFAQSIPNQAPGLIHETDMANQAGASPS